MRLLTNSIFIAVVVFVAIGLWIVSGQGNLFSRDNQGETPPTPSSDRIVERPLTRVQTVNSAAVPFIEQLVFTGVTTADRKVDLRAETAGRVNKIFAKEGQTIPAGFLVLSLDKGDLDSQKKMSESRVNQRQIEFDAAQQLAAKDAEDAANKRRRQAGGTQGPAGPGGGADGTGVPVDMDAQSEEDLDATPPAQPTVLAMLQRSAPATPTAASTAAPAAP